MTGIMTEKARRDGLVQSIVSRLRLMAAMKGVNNAVLMVEADLKRMIDMCPERAELIKEAATIAGERYIAEVGKEILRPSIIRANSDDNLIFLPKIKEIRQSRPNAGSLRTIAGDIV